MQKFKYLLIFFFAISLSFLVSYVNSVQQEKISLAVDNTSVTGQFVQKTNFDNKNNCKDVSATQFGGSNLQDIHYDSKFIPEEKSAFADKTNFGERFANDVFGKSVKNLPLIVLHETVISAAATIQLFQTPHPLDQDQASYHILITRSGEIVHLVPLEKRAFGAGNSVFFSMSGSEEVKTNLKISASVNNFAYHIALESPPDGNNESRVHSGYTNLQYKSLAWLINKMNILESRITTHYAVDRTNSRKDPRSFDVQKFYSLLNAHQSIFKGCNIN